jgi:signal transduction histidine kinase
VLLFDPGIAVLIAGVGSLISQSLRREPPEQVLFNSCHTALQAGLAGLALASIDQGDMPIAFDHSAAIIGALTAAVVMYVVDVVAIGIVVRLESGQPLRSIFQEMPEGSLLDDLSQFALGLMTAITVNAYIWTLPFVVLLAFQMHRAGQRSMAAQKEERRLRAESERIANDRKEFLLTASHELKTPITSVKMAAQLLDRALIQRDPAFQADAGSIARWRDQLMLGIERLENLVAELLDATRIQQGRLELHPRQVDLSEMALAVVERFQIAAERRPTHALILDAPEPVEGFWDPSGLDQILTNLVSNALKYSPDGGRVTVRVFGDGDDAVLTVADTGIGITPEQQDELFKPFARASTLEHGITGTGLGLYITKRVIEQHGGDITLESIPGIGTTFIVTLPRNPPLAIESTVAENATAVAT